MELRKNQPEASLLRLRIDPRTSRLLKNDGMLVSKCNQPMRWIVRRKPYCNGVSYNDFNIESFHFTAETGLYTHSVFESDMVNAAT